MNGIYDKVVDIIREQMCFLGDITGEMRIMEELKADSLDHVEIIMSVEDEFDIEISDEVAERMFTVNDIVKYVEESLR